jgi:CPA1 family monovalent cation:H+ antiporter
VWDVVTFLLNATLFVLIGLQLPVVLDALTGQPVSELLGYAALVSVAVIGARFAWSFTVPTSCGRSTGVPGNGSAAWARRRGP